MCLTLEKFKSYFNIFYIYWLTNLVNQLYAQYFVYPGTIDTPFHAQIKSTKPEVFASWKSNIMLGRLGQPEEVASVVSFLAGNDAAFITAETIQIGGGQALGI